MAGKKRPKAAVALKRKRLVQFVKEAPPPHRITWFDEIEDADIREQLLELRAEVRAGRLKRPVAELHRLCSEHIGLQIGNQGFAKWLRGETDGK